MKVKKKPSMREWTNQLCDQFAAEREGMAKPVLRSGALDGKWEDEPTPRGSLRCAATSAPCCQASSTAAITNYYTQCREPGCGVSLTSENRYGHWRMCKEHGRKVKAEQVQARKARVRAVPKVNPAAWPASCAAVDPRRQELHAMLDLTLNFPGSAEYEERLRQGLIDWALRAELVKRIDGAPAALLHPFP